MLDAGCWMLDVGQKMNYLKAFVRRPSAAEAIAEETNGYMQAWQNLGEFYRLNP